MTTPDPNIIYKRVERGLWAALEADANFAATVQPNNRIKHCTDAQPDMDKPFNLPADMPAVRIAPNGWKRYVRGSNTYALELSYVLEVWTGDKRTTRWYGDAQWYAWIVFLRMNTVDPSTAMSGVSEFVKIEAESATQDLARSETTDIGWIAAIDMKVVVKFDIAVITA